MKTNPIKLFPSVWSMIPEELAKLENAYIDQGNRDNTARHEAFLNFTPSGQSPNIEIRDNIGILKIEGPITQKADFFTFLFGGAPLDVLTDDFKRLVDDEEVETIILAIDSPGGTVAGVQEFANMVFDARQEKRILALSSSIMASAAMWIGAAADELFISDNTVTTGSIGVLTTHICIELLNIRTGIEPTEITAGKFKRITSSLKPLSNEGKAVLQAQVDHIMDVFVGDVARFRGVSEQDVAVNMADGKVFIGDQAIKVGLIDDIKSLDLLIQTISEGGFEMGLFAKNKEANMDNLQAEHGDLYNAAVQVGKDQERKSIEAETKKAEESAYGVGKEEGVKAERARLEGIDNATIAGQEDLAKKLKADGVTTPGDAALAMIAADRETKKAGLETIKKEAPKAIEDEIEETITAEADKTPEEKFKASKDLQREFGDYETYKAFVDNSDQINIFKGSNV